MIANLEAQWTWQILPTLLRTAFAPISKDPLPVWAGGNVFLDRKITTKPGYYDVTEFLWTWEFQEIARTRELWTAPHPADGVICIVDPGTPGAKCSPVTRETVMKSSVAGYTEAALNIIRWIAKNDPQNVIFSIDSRTEAGNVNEVRLQPTLRRRGEEIFSGAADDVSKYMINLRRMLIYFLGSYSEAAYANKMCEVAIGDELEEHGDANTVDNLESRLKSAARPLLILLSKPKLEGGPIDVEWKKGTMCVYEIPCPHCGAYQQLLRDQAIFEHCKDLYGEWDFARVATESYFRCINTVCKKPIEEHWKRWFNERTRRRWRITNPNPEPGHVSFHMSDFYGYHAEAKWGNLNIKYIQSKGDPVARQARRNHDEGLPWEQRATKTEVEDLMALRGPYKRGTLPWKPAYLLLGADVGLHYVKWSVWAFKRDSEMACIDWGEVIHPDDMVKLMAAKSYPGPGANGNVTKFRIQMGVMDGKYRKDEVRKACLLSGRKLWPIVGNNADLMLKTISTTKIPGCPEWFKVIVFADRDAKSELYEHRINAWADWERRGKLLRPDDPKRVPPDAPRIWFPEDMRKDDTFALEHCNERLVELTSRDEGWMPHAAKQFIWKRKGPNHGGDTSKTCLVEFRYLTRTQVMPVTPSQAES